MVNGILIKGVQPVDQTGCRPVLIEQILRGVGPGTLYYKATFRLM